MILDDYIYDSQFQFLDKNLELESEFNDTVLRNIKKIEFQNEQAFIKIENWDSEKLNKKVIRLIWLSNSKNKLFYDFIYNEFSNYDCVYVRLNQNHTFINYLKEYKNVNFTNKLTQHLDLSHYPKTNESVLKIEKLTSQNITIVNQIKELASNSFKYNRFVGDKNFSQNFINNVYSSWVSNEIENNETDIYYIHENNILNAFLLYKKNVSPLKTIKVGFIGLIATQHNSKNKNYASLLLNYAFKKAITENTNYVIANTESRNTSALNFFKKNNFKVTSTLFESNIWVNKNL